MTISVSDEYLAQEQACASTPKTYVAILRDTYTTLLSDGGGIHTNTQFSGGILSLTGTEDGYWESDVIDSEYLTGLVIYDLITWSESLNGGTTQVYLRSATTENAIVGKVWDAYSDNVLIHKVGFRYYQIKIALSYGTSSPQVSSMSIRRKGLINPDNYTDIGDVEMGSGVDFHELHVGDLSVSFDNRSHQWEKRNSESFIYGKTFLGGTIEVWAGFEVFAVGFDVNTDYIASTGVSTSGVVYIDGLDEDFQVDIIPLDSNDYSEFERTEWNILFLGKIQEITTESAGTGTVMDASVSAKDYLYDRLKSHTVGAPLSDGTPNPYIKGRRYREDAKEIQAYESWKAETEVVSGELIVPTTEDGDYYECTTAGTTGIDEPDPWLRSGEAHNDGTAVWTNRGHAEWKYGVYGELEGINGVLYRDSETNKYLNLYSGEYVADHVNGTITFQFQQTKQLVMDVQADSSIVHPVDIIQDVINNEVGISGEFFDNASFNAARNVFPNLECGVSFESIDALSLCENLTPCSDTSLVVESGKIKIKSYRDGISTSSQTFTSGEYLSSSGIQTLDYMKNKLICYFGDYEDDTTNMIELEDASSVASYGERMSEYSFKHKDSVSFANSTYLEPVMNQIHNRYKDLTEIIEIDAVWNVIRTEIFDVVPFTNGPKSIDSENMLVLNKSVRLSSREGTLQVIPYG